MNLINRKGYEHRLGEYLQALVDRASNGHLRYEPFDFHKECSKMRWDRLSLLMDKLEDALTLQAYFSVDYSGKPLTTQKSVVRTNCMDCLDRTNVVQSLLARRALRHFLVSRQVLDAKAQIADVPSMERALRTIWADNADAVSVTYSGTGALKTDFTRTGKRTRQGALQDGVNSAVRYVRNNFWDGTRQDAFDLFLGNYTVIPGMPSPFAASYSAEVGARKALVRRAPRAVNTTKPMLTPPALCHSCRSCCSSAW